MRITIFRQFKVYYTIDYLLHVALCSWFVNRCMVRVFFYGSLYPQIIAAISCLKSLLVRPVAFIK